MLFGCAALKIYGNFGGGLPEGRTREGERGRGSLPGYGGSDWLFGHDFTVYSAGVLLFHVGQWLKKREQSF